jgi:PD-(D/E)XK nuclease superfamily
MTTPPDRALLEEQITRSVIGSFYDVHRELGFGFRERIYSLAMERALVAKGHRVEREVDVMVSYVYSTTIEVGLLLHFGREPRFKRVICENRFKAHYLRG